MESDYRNLSPNVFGSVWMIQFENQPICCLISRIRARRRFVPVYFRVLVTETLHRQERLRWRRVALFDESVRSILDSLFSLRRNLYVKQVIGRVWVRQSHIANITCHRVRSDSTDRGWNVYTLPNGYPSAFSIRFWTVDPSGRPYLLKVETTFHTEGTI